MTGGRFQTSRYAFKVGMNYVYVRKYNPNGACLKVPNTFLHYISYSALRRKIILMYLVSIWIRHTIFKHFEDKSLRKLINIDVRRRIIWRFLQK